MYSLKKKIVFRGVDIEQQLIFCNRENYNRQPQNKGGQNQREHHLILTKYEAVCPTAVLENNS